MKKALSVFLLLSILLLAFPFPAGAADEIIEIGSYEELKNNLKTTGNYKLTADIVIDENRSTSIVSGSFTGSFDGDGHSITFAEGKKGTLSSGQGLFFEALGTNAKISNVSLGTPENSLTVVLGDTTGGMNPGVLAGSTTGATPTISGVDCYVVVSGTRKTATNFGSFLGNAANSVEIENSTVNGSVSLDGTAGVQNMGAFIGIVRTGGTVRLRNCVNNADITVNGTAVGGASSVGGMVGAIVQNGESTQKSTMQITNCVNNGALTCSKICGGMIGYVNNGANLSERPYRLTGCQNFGKIGAGTRGGGMIGSAHKVSNPVNLTGCVNSGEIVATANSAALAGMIGRNYKTADCTLTMCYNFGTIDENGKTEVLTGTDGLVVNNDASAAYTVTSMLEEGTVFTMKNVAAVRILEPMGIRFTAMVDEGAYKAAQDAFGQNIRLGLLIAPEQYVTDAGAFTAEALNALKAEKNITTDTYLDCVCNDSNRTEDGNTIFTGAVTSRYEKQYSLDYQAISYIAIRVGEEWKIVAYATEATGAVSMAYIAKQAWNNRVEEGFTEAQISALEKYFTPSASEAE